MAGNPIYVEILSWFKTQYKRVYVSALKWFFILVAIVAFLLFLYGANYYDAVVGWVGVALLAASLVGFLVFYVYEELMKRAAGAQKS